LPAKVKKGIEMRSSNPILLVEAYRADAVLVEQALKDLKVTNQLVDAPDAKKASAYLRTKGVRKPCLILLDLATPEPNGIEFLTTLKAHKSLAKIPVVVLATSEKERDVVESLGLGVAGYIVKPVDYKKFVEAVRKVDLCWTLSEPPDER
jgi:DNA-binding response OmpR family regulator